MQKGYTDRRLEESDQFWICVDACFALQPVLEGTARDAQLFGPLALTGDTRIAMLKLVQLRGNLFSRPLLSGDGGNLDHSGTSPRTGKVFYQIILRLFV